MAAKLTPKGRAWLKGFHILFSSTWVGAALCMVLLHFSYQPSSGNETHTMLSVLKRIDDWVIIPSAIGTLITSILISALTSWGFFKWTWVTVKWVLTIAIMLFGTFFLGPWLNGMEALAAADPQLAVQNPQFLTSHQLMSYAVGPQLITLLSIVFISVLKPWKPTKHSKTSNS